MYQTIVLNSHWHKMLSKDLENREKHCSVAKHLTQWRLLHAESPSPVEHNQLVAATNWYDLPRTMDKINSHFSDIFFSNTTRNMLVSLLKQLKEFTVYCICVRAKFHGKRGMVMHPMGIMSRASSTPWCSSLRCDRKLIDWVVFPYNWL